MTGIDVDYKNPEMSALLPISSHSPSRRFAMSAIAAGYPATRIAAFTGSQGHYQFGVQSRRPNFLLQVKSLPNFVAEPTHP